MTGYGRADKVLGTQPAVQLAVETRSVNSRFLEINLRLPAQYSDSERDFRQLVSAGFARGRIELLISRKAAGQQSGLRQNADPLILRKKLAEAEDFSRL